MLTDEQMAAGFRVRVNHRLFRKPVLILQVREMRPYNFDPTIDFKPGGYCEHWRNATVDDVLAHKPEKPHD